MEACSDAPYWPGPDALDEPGVVGFQPKRFTEFIAYRDTELVNAVECLWEIGDEVYFEYYNRYGWVYCITEMISITGHKFVRIFWEVYGGIDQ